MNMIGYYAIFSFEPATPGRPLSADTIGVEFPDWGNATYGHTWEHAKIMALDLLQLNVIWAQEDGEELPPPSPPEKISHEPGSTLVLIEYDADTFDPETDLVTISDEARHWRDIAVCPVCGCVGLSTYNRELFICGNCLTQGKFLDPAIPVVEEEYMEMLENMTCPECGTVGMYPNLFYNYCCSNSDCCAEGSFPDRKAAWDAGGTLVQRKAAWDAHRKNDT